jgi:hypothetical protein
VEDTWIMRLLFKNNHIIESYDKRYEAGKRHTTHIIISNKGKSVEND